GCVIEGTFQLSNASVHVNASYADTKRGFDTMEVVLDEDVRSDADVRALGVEVGDIVCFDPRTRVTESGYIKSRFLDDKLSVGILLGLAKYLSDNAIALPRRVYAHITVYEEVGHGGASSVPAGVTEAVSVDMGCVGEGLSCTEKRVSICAKDSGGPYSYELVGRLIEGAKRAGADYAVDVYPRYGSDVETTLCAGHDVRHGLIGAGVYASHGYERSHRDGVRNALLLLAGFLNV
ncbi:MAG: peptidase M42, partial [Eubacteriales bacterium]|nr:peptidase M42 [Eubacteriales bacterium]